MKKITALFGLSFLAACLSGPAAMAANSDIYTGTLEIVGGHPLLLRCDDARNTYLLVDEKGEHGPYAKKLAALGVKKDQSLQATVRGVVSKRGEEIVLEVEAIEDVKPGSCHAAQ
ncbi:hypothetical protein LJB99_02540 [Deltaproteobacteria bacterium OttesenSCG-928-K17]|nr:hypothetical protein [Deltaproteobacteria bacterium OttesenSCG-928-K17]